MIIFPSVEETNSLANFGFSFESWHVSKDCSILVLG